MFLQLIVCSVHALDLGELQPCQVQMVLPVTDHIIIIIMKKQGHHIIFLCPNSEFRKIAQVFDCYKHLTLAYSVVD